MIQEAYNYFYNERLFSDTRLNATDKQQNQALNMATNQVKRLVKDMDLDNEDVKKAVFEQALYLLETQNSDRAKLIEQGVTSFSVEGLSESYDTSKIKSSSKSKICSESLAYLKQFLGGSYEIC